MRELRFRAWHEKLGRMFDDVCVDSNGTELLDDTGKAWWIGHEHIMQFTGLKDKNGREIYEGDIVIQDRYMWVDEGKPNYRGTVEWIYSQWQVVAHCVNPKKRGISDGINMGLNEDGYNDGEKTEWEVLGNIWENKELLLNVPSEKGE